MPSHLKWVLLGQDRAEVPAGGHAPSSPPPTGSSASSSSCRFSAEIHLLSGISFPGPLQTRSLYSPSCPGESAEVSCSAGSPSRSLNDLGAHLLARRSTRRSPAAPHSYWQTASSVCCVSPGLLSTPHVLRRTSSFEGTLPLSPGHGLQAPSPSPPPPPSAPKLLGLEALLQLAGSSPCDQ